MQLVRPPYLMRAGSYGAGGFSGAVSASFSSPNITVTATTGAPVTRFGFTASVNGGAATAYDGAGAASAQSITVSLTDIGAVAGDLICIDPFYSMDALATTKVYASAYGLYITPSITTPTISDTTPTVGDTLTGTNGTTLARYTNATSTGATRSVLWLADGSSTGDTDNSYTIVVGDIGKTLSFRNTTSDGGTATSAATAAIVAAGPPGTPSHWFKFNTGITQSGGFVSRWVDQTAGNDLLQASGSNQPSVSGGVITFNGVDQFLKCAAFTLDQPCTIALRGTIITWADVTRMWHGDAAGSGEIRLAGVSPQINLNAGTPLGPNSNATVGVLANFYGVLNSTSSVLKVDATASTTGDAGTNNMGGFTLGAGSGGGQACNMSVREIVIYNSALDATALSALNTYLNGV